MYVHANSLEPAPFDYIISHMYRQVRAFSRAAHSARSIRAISDRRYVGVQSGGVRGHVGLRVGAGPRQPGECPGVQGAIGERARRAILGADGKAEPPADYEPPLDLRQGVRAAGAGDQVRPSTGERTQRDP